MSSKKWLVTFFATLVLIGIGVLCFNFLMDPFGVFSARALEWPSYEMTMNPRTAKFTYIEKHHGEYDSYIVGCSSASSYPTQALNRYLDASFYNMFTYGADMLDVEQFCSWLLENAEVRNLVVSVYIDNALRYDTLSDPLSYAMPAELTGESPLAFYSKYLFMDPRYSKNKLLAMMRDTYLVDGFDVFNALTGSYDKRVRDAEPIGDMDSYLVGYPYFADYPHEDYTMSEEAIAGTLESLTRIRDLCREKGARLLVVCNPVYAGYWDYFDTDEIEDFYSRLAEVTPYWDFSYSSVSFEPRYFYDETHFRNCVGDMALARIFGDESIYIPDDFGAYVTAENVREHLDSLTKVRPRDEKEYTAHIPVLMYHSVNASGGGDSTVITPERFEAHMAALSQAGYTAVLPDELEAYVEAGTPLPEKPIVITFDDGYLDNYTNAFPILRKYDLRAVIFAIGATVGQTEHYKDTEFEITPHFSYEQAREMVESGLVSVQSHTYDMHQWAPYESGRARENILRWEGEDEDSYISLLTADCAAIRKALVEGTGQKRVNVMAFPSGMYDVLSQEVLQENGFDVTFGYGHASAVLIKGMPQSLLSVNRYAVSGTVSVETLLEWVSGARG